MRGVGSWTIGILAAALVAGLAHADVVNLPPEGFSSVEPLGGLELRRTYGPRPGRTCLPSETRPKGCVLIAAAAEWAPPNLPLSVSLERRGDRLMVLMTSLLYDRKGRPACLSRHVLAPADAARPGQTWSRMKAEFYDWSRSCAVVGALGAEQARAAFDEIGPDMTRAHGVLLAAGRLPDTPDEIALGSFLPTMVSQPLLDAVALACEGPVGQARLEPDGAIAWRFDRNEAYGPDGARPFGLCVDDQIRYYPGYRPQR